MLQVPASDYVWAADRMRVHDNDHKVTSCPLGLPSWLQKGLHFLAAMAKVLADGCHLKELVVGGAHQVGTQVRRLMLSSISGLQRKTARRC